MDVRQILIETFPCARPQKFMKGFRIRKTNSRRAGAASRNPAQEKSLQMPLPSLLRIWPNTRVPGCVISYSCFLATYIPYRGYYPCMRNDFTKPLLQSFRTAKGSIFKTFCQVYHTCSTCCGVSPPLYFFILPIFCVVSHWREKNLS